MTETNSSQTLTGALHAKISEVLYIRDDDHLKVWLTIISENRTNETIDLDENYHIPMNDASQIEVYDINNKERLTGFFNQRRRRIEIVFKQGTRLPPGQKFSWSVKYKTPRFGVIAAKEEQLITGVFALVPRKSYKHIPIETHHVKLRAVFLRPRQGDSYKELNVFQSNSQNIPAEIKQKQDRVVCVYRPFVLVKGSKLRVTFNYQYRTVLCTKTKPGSRLRRFVAAVKAIVLSTAPAMLTIAFKELLDWIFRNKG